MKEKSITFIDDETDKADVKVKDVFVDKDEVDDDLDFLEYQKDFGIDTLKLYLS